jgi:hypothetical protein
METANAIAEELDALTNDPLFVRLWTIRQEVESGRADAETVERWEELRETVTAIVESLRATMMAVPPHERDKAAKDWIQAFMDQHWPVATRH